MLMKTKISAANAHSAEKTLKRSAARLARSASGILATPAVAKAIKKLQKLMAIEQAARMAQADLIVALIDGHGLRAIDIARQLGVRPKQVTNLYKTAVAFPPRKRPAKAVYNHLYLAALMTRKFPELKMTPTEALGELDRTGLTQHRDISRHFGALARNRLALASYRHADAPVGMILSRFQEAKDRFSKGSIKLLVVDPPYYYPRQANGGYGRKGASRLEADEADREGAVGSVLDLLAGWQDRLAPGGCLLLWQATQMMHPDVAKTMHDGRWEYDKMVWIKGRPQACDLDSAVAPETEDLYLLYRPGENPRNHDGSRRSNVLSFQPLSRPGLQADQDHIYEKPVEMMRHLVGKLTFRGELVVELCGCTAPTTVATIQAGRRWAYVESNAGNFELGRRRIAAALDAAHKLAG